MACAMVTAAGTPYLRCVAIAPGTTSSMNACWALTSRTGAADRGGRWRRYGVADPDGRCGVTGTPGTAAAPAVAVAATAAGPAGAVPGTSAPAAGRAVGGTG